MADTKKQDAIALLKADHDEVRQLFKDFEKAGDDGRREKLARQICRELTIHSMIEEEIFYPACEGKVDEDLLKEGYVEHDAAKLMIAEIEAGEPSDEFYDSKVKVLSEEVDHHIQEEEKRMEGLFSQARRAGLDMDQLGERLARRKAELTEQTESGDLPAPELTTMDEASV
jgi:hemerythrin superfamily protein